MLRPSLSLPASVFSSKKQEDDDGIGCPRFANMRDACMLICCFFSFGGKDQHALTAYWTKTRML